MRTRSLSFGLRHDRPHHHHQYLDKCTRFGILASTFQNHHQPTKSTRSKPVLSLKVRRRYFCRVASLQSILAMEAPKRTEKGSTLDETYASSSLIPSNKKSRRIYHDAEIKTGNFSKADYDERFLFVSGELQKALESHPGLQGMKEIAYYLRMVGESPEAARPSIVVVCGEAGFKDIKALLDERGGRLHCGKFKSPFLPLFRGRRESIERPPVPPLELVYYRTPYGGITRNMSSGPLKARLRNDQTWCGSIIQFESRAATLGLTVYVDGFFGVMTVDHLFPDTPDVANDSSNDHSRSTNLLTDLATSSGLTFPIERPESRDSMDRTPLESLGDNAEAGHIAMQAYPYNAHSPDPYGTWYFSPDDEFDSNSVTSELDRDEVQSTDNFQGVTDMPSEIFNIDQPEEEWERILPSHPLDLSEPYLDWALTKPLPNYEISGERPSMFVSPEGSSTGTLVALGTLSKPPGSGQVKVFVVSGLRGVLRGRLLAGSVLIGSAPGQGLCQVWPLRLDSDPGTILKGECGSVVVDQGTNDVYGHVVGSGPFGDAYVVTLEHILAQVKTCFDAVHVAISPPRRGGAASAGVTRYTASEPGPNPRQQDPSNPTSPTEDNMLDQPREMPESEPQLRYGSQDEFDEDLVSDRPDLVEKETHPRTQREATSSMIDVPHQMLDAQDVTKTGQAEIGAPMTAAFTTQLPVSGGSSSSHTSPKLMRHWFWFCHECGEGPYPFDLSTHCVNPSCYSAHARCEFCRLESETLGPG
ncbi:hypothetical protein B0T19DRAFT_428699 [Cercophora scortea]|uniref:Uncharacterized protein n=1 Tax=Cercophora scortea TaxID=314031 RepID=A0AAE0IG32_9PEZI|nr:hypothetical protein B0T19DRAFT_428699 [Cercophora scortea]